MDIAHRYKACSTIVFGNFSEYRNDDFLANPLARDQMKKEIIWNLKDQIKGANQKNHTRKEANPYGNDQITKHRLDNHKVGAFAFFFTTMYAKSAWTSKKFNKMADILEEIGFKVDRSEDVYNSKNETYIWPVIGVVSAVLYELSKYDDEGNLIEKPKKVARDSRGRFVSPSKLAA